MCVSRTYFSRESRRPFRTDWIRPPKTRIHVSPLDLEGTGSPSVGARCPSVTRGSRRVHHTECCATAAGAAEMSMVVAAAASHPDGAGSAGHDRGDDGGGHGERHLPVPSQYQKGIHLRRPPNGSCRGHPCVSAKQPCPVPPLDRGPSQARHSERPPGQVTEAEKRRTYVARDTAKNHGTQYPETRRHVKGANQY